MPSNIVVPEVGESIVDARVAKWLRKEGDAVSIGDPLVELETDKVDLEVAATQAGVLTRIDRKDGEDVKVGEVLGVIDDAAAGALREPRDTGGAAAAQKPAASPAAAAKSAADAKVVSEPRAASEKTRSTPTARKAAEDKEVDLRRVRGSGDAGRVMLRDVQQAAAGSEGRPAPASGTGVAAPAQAAEPAREAKARPAPPLAEGPRRPAGERQEERVRMSKRRATIARRLVEAQSTAAMLSTFNEVDMSAVMALRERHKQGF
jgi:2-oxoglutarate dehydrogenase E2 component (dihydrolipoamide succinyltransferase)